MALFFFTQLSHRSLALWSAGHEPEGRYLAAWATAKRRQYLRCYNTILAKSARNIVCFM